MGAVEKPAITVVTRDEVDPIPLPNGSWSRMVLTRETAPGIVSSLGYSVFTPGTATGMVSHEVEEVAYVARGSRRDPHRRRPGRRSAPVRRCTFRPDSGTPSPTPATRTW